MAKNLLDEAEQRYGGALPAGVSQAQPTGNRNLLDLAQEWYGGANRESTSNGWSTDFLARWQEQTERAQAEGRLAQQYEEDDRTGVILFNYTGKGTRGQHVSFRAGDVYDNGEYLGNVYDSYDRETADALMAPFLLDAQTQAQTFAGRAWSATGSLREEVERRVQENSEDYAKAVSATAFAERQEQRTQELQEMGPAGLGNEIATIAAGAAGGAAAVSGAAAVLSTIFPGLGTIAGGALAAGGAIVGGVAAWLNRDEFVETGGRVWAQIDTAREEHGGWAGLAAGVGGAGQLALLAMNVPTNTFKGLYDWNWGNGSIGDGESRFYEVDPVTGERTAPGWAQVANVALGIPDAIGQWGSRAAMRAFTAAMGSQILGSAAEPFVTGGEKFNPWSGRYDPVLWGEGATVGSALAAIGHDAIDVLQLGLGHGMVRGVERMRAAVGAERLAESRLAESASKWLNQLRGVPRGARTEVVGGRRFWRTAEGALAGGKRTVTAMIVPSETFVAMQAGMLARRAAARDAGRAVSVDDLYRASVELAGGSDRWLRTALVNGFAEGYEEGLQALLEPVQFGERVDGRQVIESFAAGTAMGLGMGVGISRGRTAGGPVPDTEALRAARAYALHQTTSGKRLSPEEFQARWAKMSEAAKRKALAASEVQERTLRAAGAVVASDWSHEVAAGEVEVQAVHDALRKVESAELSRAASKTDRILRITALSDPRTPSHVAQFSLQDVIERLREKLEGTTEALQDADLDPAQREFLRLKEEQARIAIGVLTAQLRDFTAATTLADRRAALDKANLFLRRWWEADPERILANPETRDLPPEEVERLRLARAQVVTLLFERSPNVGLQSVVALLPQADLLWTDTGATFVMGVSQSILPAMGGDYDGDMLRQFARRHPTPEEFALLRSGRNREGISLEKTFHDKRDWEDRAVEQIHEALQAPAKSARHRRARQMVRRVGQRLVDAFGPLPELDKAVAEFGQALVNGDPDAKTVLISALRRRYLETLTKHGYDTWTDPWGQVDDIVAQEYQAMQRYLAERFISAAKHPELAAAKEVTGIEPVPQDSATGSIRRERSVTVGMTVLEQLAASDPFRAMQQLHVAARREPVLQDESPVTDPREWLQRWYVAMNEGAPLAEIDRLRTRDMLTGRVAYTMRRWAADLGASIEAPQQALGLLLVVAVPNVGFDGTRHGDRDISLVQMLLRESVAMERSLYATTGRIPEEVEQRLSTLEAMTRNPDDHWQAVLEVFGDYPLVELLGEEADSVGADRTLRQHVMEYTAGDRRFITLLHKEDAAYGQRKETTNLPVSLAEARSGNLTALHAISDLIREAGHKRLYIDGDGDVRGTLAAASEATSKRFRQGMGELIKMFGEYVGHRNLSRMSIEDVQQVMQENPDWTRAYFEMLAEVSPLVIKWKEGPDGTPTPYGARWVYEMLTQPVAQAEVTLFRNTLLGTLNLNGLRPEDDPDDGSGHARAWSRLRDTWHQLMYRLARTEDLPRGGGTYEDFLHVLTTATSIEDLTRQVNHTFRRADEAPFVPWVRDVAEFDPDRVQEGWTPSAYGADQRKAIADWATRTARLSAEIREELAAERHDVLLVQRLLEGEPEATKAAQDKLDLIASLGPMTGPRQWVYQTAAAIQHWFADATDKGVAAEHTVPAGDAEITQDIYAGAFMRSATSLGTYSLSDIVNNPALLAKRDMMIQDDDGRMIHWQRPTPRMLAEMWQQGEATRSLVRALLSVGVVERGENGESLLQTLEGRTLTSLLETGNLRALFEPGAQNRRNYLLLVEGRAAELGTRHAIQRLANDIAIAKLSSATAPMDAAAVAAAAEDVYRWLPDFLQHLGALLYRNRVGDSVPTNVRDELVSLARVLFISRTTGLAPADVLSEHKDVILETVKAKLFTEAAKRESSEPGAMRVTEAYFKFVDMVLDGDVLGRLDETYGYWPDRPLDQRNTRKRDIYRYVSRHMKTLQTRTPWAVKSLVRFTNALRSNVPVDPNNPQGERLPRLDDADWETIGRAIVALELDNLTVRGPNRERIVELPERDSADRAYFDPSYSYLISNLFDRYTGLADALVDVYARAGAPAIEASSATVVDILGRNVFSDEHLNTWTMRFPQVSIAANKRLDTPGVPHAIASVGSTPPERLPIALATQRTGEAVPDELVTRATFELGAILSGDPYTQAVPVVPAGTAHTAQNPDLMPLVMLNGRFARAAVLEHSSGDPDRAIDLLARGRIPQLGVQFRGSFELEQDEFVTISLARLRNAIRNAVPPAQIGEYRLTLEFVHPDSKPANGFAHNVLFDGVASDSGADGFDSLEAAKWQTAEGLLQRAYDGALKANKRGVTAWFTPTIFSLEQKQRDEENWQTDLAAVLRRKAIRLLQVDVDGSNVLPPDALFNSFYKDQEIHHFVRGINADGEAELWSAQQVIAWQKTGQPLPLTDAELVVFSDEVLLKALGDTSEFAAPSMEQPTALEIDYSRIKPWDGTTAEIVARVPGVLEREEDEQGTSRWATRSILATRAGARRPVSRLWTDFHLSSQTKTRLNRGLEIRARAAAEALTARTNNAHMTGERLAAQAESIISWAKDELRRADVAQAAFVAAEAVSAGRRLSGRARSESQLMDSLLEQMRAKTGLTVWKVAPVEGTTETQQQGTLTKVHLEKFGERTAYTVVAGEVAVVDVAAFARLPYQVQLAEFEEDLQYLAGAGAVVVIPAVSGDLAVYAQTYLQSHGYTRFAETSRTIFVPPERQRTSQVLRARLSGHFETRPISYRNRVVVFSADDIPLGANAIAWADPEGNPLRQVLVVSDLLPVTPGTRFAPPRTTERIRQVIAQLREVFTDGQNLSVVSEEGLRYAATLSGLYDPAKPEKNWQKKRDVAKLRADLNAMLERWADPRFETAVLPVAGMTFGTGHIIPLWDGKRIILSRFGHQMPNDAEIAAQWAIPHPATGTGNIAIYRPMVDDNATTHEGVVERVEYAGRGRRRLHIAARPQTIGAKVEFDLAGYKGTLTTLADDAVMLPSRNLFGDEGIHAFTNDVEMRSKNSFEARVDNFAWAFAAVGMDFTVPLTRALFRDEYDRADAAGKKRLEARMIDALSHFSRNAASLTRDEVVELLANIDGATVTDALDAAARLVPDTTLPLGAMKQADQPVELRILRRVLVYLMAQNTRLHDVLRTGGANSVDAFIGNNLSRLMPSVFTDTFDNLPVDDPLHQYLIDELNSRLPDPTEGDGGYHFEPNLQLTITRRIYTDEGVRVVTRTGWLSLPELIVTEHNPATDAMAATGNRQQVSPHAQAVARMSGLPLDTYRSNLERARRLLSREGVYELDEDGVWELLHDFPDEHFTRRRMELTPMADSYLATVAGPAADAFLQPIDPSLWADDFDTKAERNAADAAFQTLRARVARAMNLTADQAHHVDYMVRLYYGIGKDPREGSDIGRVPYHAAMTAMTRMLNNLQKGRLPSYGAQVPVVPLGTLRAMFDGYRRRTGTYAPYKTEGRPDSVAETFDEWAHVMFGTLSSTQVQFSPLHAAALDGLVHHYARGLEDFHDLQITREVLKEAGLVDPDTNRVFASLNPDVLARLEQPSSIDGTLDTYEWLFGQATLPQVDVGMPEPGSEEAKQLNRKKAWLAKNVGAIPARTTPANFHKRGIEFVNTEQHTVWFLRVWQNMRIGNTLVNPVMAPAQLIDAAIRGGLDTLTGLLTGTSLARTGEVAGKVGLSLYSDAEREQLDQLVTSLSNRGELLNELMGEMTYKAATSHRPGAVERFSQWYAQLGARMQEPTWGMRPRDMMRRYVEAAVEFILARPSVQLTIPQLASRLKTDPLYLQKYVREAHDYARARVAAARGLKTVTAQLMIQNTLNTLSASPSKVLNWSGNILKIQAAFSRFWTGTFTTLAGLQGADAIWATYLNGRRTRLSQAVGKARARIEGRPYDPVSDGTWDTSAALEGVEIARAFIQGGLTHTSLAAFALISGGLGLTGEDEEAKRRRRAAQYQHGIYWYDPRDIANDFRNADAVFLNNIPLLAGLFKGPDGQPAMAVPHWAIKQFLSPIMGIDRFIQTGDPRQILWGFEDALGSLPWVNLDTWQEASRTALELLNTAKTRSDADTIEAQMAAWEGVINAVSVLERQLLENTFAAQVYQAIDEYDRDPWTMPLRDSDREIQGDIEGNPRPTTGLTQYRDEETGETRFAYATYDPRVAMFRALAENRPTLAILSELFTGFRADTWRLDMVPKIREDQKPVLTMEEAEGLVLSILDANGMEVLTENGARAVFEGLRHGTVNFGDPALENVYVSRDMRRAIMVKWQAELVQEGIDMGLDEYEAKRRMWELWRGPEDQPWVLGIEDILFSDQISYSPTNVYYQLNTTYVIGPDGRPWATGLGRHALYSMLGFAPLQRYLGTQPGLGLDERLNTTDPVAGTNIGLRGLKKIDRDSWYIPTDEEIAKDIQDALQDVFSRSFQPSSWSSGGYRRGGGGGGGGYSTRMTAPQDNITPYGNTIPSISMSNPIIRRASIRRERFSSDRGRLKPWQ